MVNKPRLLDLFSGAGGCARGYQMAGFHVTGVDAKPQPRYAGDVFIQGDVLSLDPAWFASFDVIHASPPCQAHSALNSMAVVKAKGHIDLIPETRALLAAAGRPWVIENVVGAPVQGFTLCGTMFGLGVDDAELRRHRLFETSWFVWSPPVCQHGAREVLGVYGGHIRNRRRTISIHGERTCDSRRKFDKSVADFTIVQGREAMGIDWMTTAELSQAIPPAYTKWIGDRLMATLQTAVAA